MEEKKLDILSDLNDSVIGFVLTVESDKIQRVRKKTKGGDGMARANLIFAFII